MHINEDKLRAGVVKRRKQLKRSENGEVPERTWRFLINMGWVQDATEMFDNEAIDYLVRWLDELDAVAPRGRSLNPTGGQLSQQGFGEEDQERSGIDEGQVYFGMELGHYEKERQQAFAEVKARAASEDREVVAFRRDYLGGCMLTSDQAHAFLESPAARYFAADLFLHLQVPAAGHRAEIVGEYEQVSDAPNDIDHRVTVRLDSPASTQRVRYARGGCPVTDGDRIDVRHCVFKDSKRTDTKTPDEVLLRYRDRDGVREVAHIWPGSILDGLRHLSSLLAKRYGWQEEDMVWFVLTGDPPRLRSLTLNVRLAAGKMTTITMTVAPWTSAETVKKNYQKVQGQLLSKGNHALSLRSLAVLRFVEKNIRERGELPRWGELLDRWKQERPEWKYQSYRGLRQAYYRALDAVVYAPVCLPKSKPSPNLHKTYSEAQ